MKQYLAEREKREKTSRVAGVALTVVLHCILFGCCFLMGFSYLYPPPPEKEQILIDFSEFEVETPRQTLDGSRPSAVRPRPEEDINLVQKSEAQNVGTESNEAPEATVDDFGDVETPEPERKKEIDRRALFSAANNKTKKDTLAAQTADRVSETLTEGHAQGNLVTGESSGEPNAKVAGRKVVGSLLKPTYATQASGIVVVKIWVDNYGTVQKAVPGAEGTTANDNALWQAARKAAMGTHFNMDGDAPAMQEGTITYIFKLN